MKEQYHDWTVLSFSHSNGPFRYWNCLCKCGRLLPVREYDLRSGKSKACKWCAVDKLKVSPITHGETRGRKLSREYGCYCHMRQRCLNPNRPDYRHYGARGIKICSQWLESFEAFLADMGRCPPGYTLERVDNSLGYCKENCKWASRSEQANNTRVVKRIEHAGVVRTVTEWARILGMNRGTLFSRFARGWDTQRALAWKT